MANNLDLDQAKCFAGPDLGPNSLRSLSADDTSRQFRVKKIINIEHPDQLVFSKSKLFNFTPKDIFRAF